MENLNDEKLIEVGRQTPGGDYRTFEILVDRHQERVLANCRFLSGSPNDAEDLAQEVFVKAFFGLQRFEGRSKFSTWLQRIKVNHCLNFLGKRKSRVFVDVDQPGLESEPEMHTEPRAERGLEAGDQRRRIAAVLDTLPETLRVPLMLRDADGLPYQEIADKLGIGLSAVKMRIKRAREEFRRLFAWEDESMERQAG